MKTRKRSLHIEADPELKATLKTLAKRSRMTLERYVNAVLEDAVKPSLRTPKHDHRP